MVSRWTGLISAVGMVCCLAGVSLAADDDDVYRSAKSSRVVKRKPDKPAEAKASSGWNWFGKKPAEPAAKPDAGKTDTAKAAASRDEETAKLLRQEQANYLRRQQVCFRLREVAEETGDTALETQADLLEQKAWSLYEARTAQLRLPSLTPMSEAAALEKLTADSTAGRANGTRSVKVENMQPRRGGKE
jgi:hypothetical protein